MLSTMADKSKNIVIRCEPDTHGKWWYFRRNYDSHEEALLALLHDYYDPEEEKLPTAATSEGFRES